MLAEQAYMNSKNGTDYNSRATEFDVMKYAKLIATQRRKIQKEGIDGKFNDEICDSQP